MWKSLRVGMVGFLCAVGLSGGTAVTWGQEPATQEDSSVVRSVQDLVRMAQALFLAKEVQVWPKKAGETPWENLPRAFDMRLVTSPHPELIVNGRSHFGARWVVDGEPLEEVVRRPYFRVLHHDAFRLAETILLHPGDVRITLPGERELVLPNLIESTQILSGAIRQRDVLIRKDPSRDAREGPQVFLQELTSLTHARVHAVPYRCKGLSGSKAKPDQR